MKLTSFCLTLILTVSGANSTQIFVPTDYSSIQTAVDSATIGDSIIIEDGHYFERIIVHKKAITLASRFILDTDSNHIINTIIDADTLVPPATDTGSALIIDSTSGGQAVVIGLTVQNGVGSLYRVFGNLYHVGGGVICAEAQVSINHCIVKNCTASSYGGGIFSVSSNLQLKNTVVRDNECLNSGGGLCLFVSTGSTVDSCYFTGNVGKDGGAAYIPFGNTVVRNSTFESNEGLLGGAIYLEDSNTPVTFCNFFDNTAYRGGAVYLYQVTDNEILSCNFINNTAVLTPGVDGLGGAICIVASQPYIGNCTLYKNRADRGGGIYAKSQGEAMIENCLITHSTKGEAYACSTSASEPIILCTNIYGNVGGDYVGCISRWDFPIENTNLDPLYCLTNARDVSLKDTSPCLPENNVCSLLIGANEMGCIVTDIFDEYLTLPVSFNLMQNYPNPFNPTTVISFTLPKKTYVRIIVTNILGQHVATLVDEIKSAGAYDTFWDGHDKSGHQMASGIYFYSIETEEYNESRKMLLLR